MYQPFVRLVALVAAATITAGFVGGCTSGSTDDKSSGKDRGSNGAVTMGGQDIDLTKPVGEVVTFEVPGSPDDTVEVGVLGLKVDGKIQVLSLVLTPHFASKSRDGRVSLYAMLGETGFHPKLIDKDNLKIYSSVESSGFLPVHTSNGQAMYVYAVFAAPEDDNTEFDLRIIDAWVPLKVKAEQ
ncbi:MAG: hypothetical protein FWF02_11380 [Micrococcales bacterium]|nr:hypothetical protein [Micrococcales bacterium]MCL2668288.1 hypothetical protein [Micrococcales bacterium]